LRKVLLSTYEASPQNFEQLLAIPGVGAKAVRALAMVAEVVYGAPASMKDPARFSFAHGGKDGHPYPVNRVVYDQSVEWLRDAAGGPVYLARYLDGEIVVVEIVDGPRTPRIDLCVGVHDAAHATALGKAILGQFTTAGRDEYLSRHPLHDLTRHTVVDPRRLQLPAPGQLAVDDEEYALGVNCMAAPVVEPGHLAAVGVVIPAPRVRSRAREALVASAGRISRALALR